MCVIVGSWGWLVGDDDTIVMMLFFGYERGDTNNWGK